MPNPNKIIYTGYNIATYSVVLYYYAELAAGPIYNLLVKEMASKVEAKEVG